MSPILCFGETGNVEEAISALEEILEATQRIDFIIFAYEPLKVVEKENVDTISEQIKEIYQYLYDKFGVRPNLIYGGGIARKDIKALLAMSELNGIMIGKGSTNISQVKKIIKDV